MSEYTEKEYEIDSSSKGLIDLINFVRNDPYPVFIIIISCLIISILFALQYKDIYKSTASLKISKPKGGILDAGLSPEIQGLTDDRFILTEIEIMKSSTVRKKVAQALFDSLKAKGSPNSGWYSTDNSFLSFLKQQSKLSIGDFVDNLGSTVNIEQRKGMNIVDISVDSPYPDIAAMMANIYADVYKKFNLEVNRDQLTMLKDFLQTNVLEKQNELKESESTLSQFQAKNGIISLDDQSKTLITQLASFEAQRDGAKIELGATEKVLIQLKDELNQQNPKVAAYIENQASQSYVLGLQEGIAKLQINKDLVSINNNKEYNQEIIKKYDDQIDLLKKKLKEKTNIIKQALFASNPEAIKDLTVKILDAEVKEKGLSSQLNQLNDIVKKYESQFNKLPLTTINYAQLQRKRESSEKLYSLLEEKYQEALINEQSQPGNIFIFDRAVIPNSPSKPNRSLIIFMGLIIGIVAGFGYIFVKDYFDDRIKSPDELEKRNINILSWVPVIENMGINGKGPGEFIVAEKPDAIPSEAFKALRTRVQFSKVGKNVLKTVLVTSAAPGEGKTVVCVNLAGAFAQDGKKTLIIDADLRKPKIHNLFGQKKTPGFTDYFFENATLDEIIRPTQLENLSIITTGTLPPNPSEILGSKRMIDFLKDMRDKFDIIILDSAPVIAVTDTEIISRLVDATLVVVLSDSTQLNLVENAVHLIKNDQSLFLGVVLNKFSYKAGYGSYYKYYYYYSGKKRDKEQFFNGIDKV